MKRFLLLLSLLLFNNIFSQTNKIIISNHRNSPVYFYIGSNTRNNLGLDCIDLAVSTKVTILQPQSEVSYKTINDALSSYPSINDWKAIEFNNEYFVDLSLSQQVSSQITDYTVWDHIKFYIEDPTINPNAEMYYLGPWCSPNPLAAQYYIRYRYEC